MCLHLYHPKGVSLFIAKLKEKDYKLGNKDKMYASLLSKLWDHIADHVQKCRSQDKPKVSSALCMRRSKTNIKTGNQ